MRTERIGALTVQLPDDDERMFAVSLHESPTQIETFKSHNHVNLVKSADIGQVLIVHNSEGDPVQLEVALSALIDMETAGQLPRESIRGLTPPMATGCGPAPLRRHAYPPHLVSKLPWAFPARHAYSTHVSMSSPRGARCCTHQQGVCDARPDAHIYAAARRCSASGQRRHRRWWRRWRSSSSTSCTARRRRGG